MGKVLKIGCIIDSHHELPAWYFETIQRMMKDTSHQIFLISVPHPKEKTSPFFYRLFQNFENSRFRSEFDAAKMVSLEKVLPGQTMIDIQTKGFVLSEGELQKLKALQFDLFYSVGFDGNAEENFSRIAQYGLWFIVFGSEDYQRSQPTAFWEVMDDSAVTGSRLLAKRGNDQWVLYEGTTRSVPYSAKNNFNSIAWKSASYLGFRLEELKKTEGDFLSRFGRLQAPVSAERTVPGISLPFLFIRNISRYLLYKLRSKFSKQRFSLFIASGEYTPGKLNQMKFEAVPLPDGGFHADPFIIEKEGVHYIFFEEYVYAKNKAHISVIEIDGHKNISSPRTVLDRSYHLSYPFVFFYKDNYYMVPESAENKTVELYRAKNFPDQWEFVMNLVEGRQLIDATLHFENDKWWLFANSADHPFVSTNDQLFIFYSTDLLSGEWTPHPQNPVATQAANCRPAGRIFRQNGKLYRPAQNNASKQYGFGLKINEIVVMTESEYEEKEVDQLEPSSVGLKACHHIDFTEMLVVIDGLRR